MVTRYYGSVLQTTIALRAWAVSSFTASHNGLTVEIRSTTPIVASNVAGAAQTGTPAFTGTQDYHRYVAASPCVLVHCCTHRLVARHSTTHTRRLETRCCNLFHRLLCQIVNTLFVFAHLISRTLPHHGNVLLSISQPSLTFSPIATINSHIFLPHKMKPLSQHGSGCRCAVGHPIQRLHVLKHCSCGDQRVRRTDGTGGDSGVGQLRCHHVPGKHRTALHRTCKRACKTCL
jgi:hypothetical protein